MRLQKPGGFAFQDKVDETPEEDQPHQHDGNLPGPHVRIQLQAHTHPTSPSNHVNTCWGCSAACVHNSIYMEYTPATRPCCWASHAAKYVLCLNGIKKSHLHILHSKFCATTCLKWWKVQRWSSLPLYKSLHDLRWQRPIQRMEKMLSFRLHPKVADVFWTCNRVISGLCYIVEQFWLGKK